MTRRRHTARKSFGRLAVILLAVGGLVLQAAGPVFAMAVPAGGQALMGMDHSDCPGHSTRHIEPAHAHKHDAKAKPSAPSDHGMPKRADACCYSQVSAGVVPLMNCSAVSASTDRGVAPQDTALLEGISPPSVAEPPRTTDQV